MTHCPICGPDCTGDCDDLGHTKECDDKGCEQDQGCPDCHGKKHHAHDCSFRLVGKYVSRCQVDDIGKMFNMTFYDTSDRE